MSSQPVIFCHCAHANVLDPDAKNVVFNQLSESCRTIEQVDDLCRMSAEEPEKLQDYMQQGIQTVAACHSRAVKWLMKAAGAPSDELDVINMRELPETDPNSPASEPATAAPALEPQGDWAPWFPVIDYDRCTNCMQCLSFCLFDVYGVSDQQEIEVRNQAKCKTNCPACSRVCPEVAIMFPKYKAGPINGDEVSTDDVRREKMKVDISELLGGDIYQNLRDRSEKAKSRFSKERSESRALKERQLCLKKLQEDLDIPPEVLANLPGADMIKARAEQAIQDTAGDASDG